MKELILFPCNGNAREALGVVNALNQRTPTWKVVGFIDDNPQLWGSTVLGVPVIGGRAKLAEYPSASVIAVPGRADNFHKRREIIEGLELPQSRFVTVVHPRAEIGPLCALGHNVVVMAGAVLTVSVTLSNHTFVMSNTVISHDSKVGEYSLVGASVAIAGGVTIESECYVGTGSRIRESLTVASGTLIGLGAVVIRSTNRNSVVVGVPAREVRIREG